MDPGTLEPVTDERRQRRSSVLFWTTALLALFLLRLPYLTSPVYVLDNDEAVLGIMARRLAAGAEVPLFFAGQNYGLAIFETLPAALAFKMFGASASVLALTILVLFLFGLIPWARVFGRLSGSEPWARALTVALALLPGWIVWSMKARGLYVSGFVLTGCALDLLTRPAALSRRHLLVAGLLMGLTGLIQPLWLAVTVPFLLLQRRPPREVALVTLVFAAVWLVPTVIGARAEAFWDPRHLSGFTPERLGVVPRVLTGAFAGQVTPHEPGVVAVAVGATAAAAFFVLLLAVLADLARRKSHLALPVATAMALSVLHVVVLRVWVPRYFLPSTVLTMVAAATWIGSRSIRLRGAWLRAAVAVIVLLALSTSVLGRPLEASGLAAVPREEDLSRVIDELEKDSVQGVYAIPSDVQWQVLFYSEEKIPTRGRSATDRFFDLPREVSQARRSGEPTALVADVRYLRENIPGLVQFPGERVGARYVLVVDPPTTMLRVLGFEPVPAVSDSTEGGAR
jgi:hypothetical protein